MKVKDTHQGIFREIHCGPICWCNEEKCSLNGAPLYRKEVVFSRGKWAISLQGCWTRQPRCIYSKYAACAFSFLGLGQFFIHDLGHVWQNCDELRSKWRSGCWNRRELLGCFSCSFGYFFFFNSPDLVGFKHIVTIILSCIYAEVELVLFFFSFPTTNHKPMWPRYNVSHSRVIAFKTKCSCWKGTASQRGSVVFAFFFFFLFCYSGNTASSELWRRNSN